jgi:hypothetical protein
MDDWLDELLHFSGKRAAGVVFAVPCSKFSKLLGSN